MKVEDQNMKAKVCKDYEELKKSGPGAVFFDGGNRLYTKSPCCGVEDFLYVNVDDRFPNYKMTGYLEAITLDRPISNEHVHGLELNSGEWSFFTDKR